MKTYFINGLIGSLVVAGLLGIGVLLSDNFDELHLRILLSTLSLSVYSVIGLCCHAIINGKYYVFSRLGLGATFIGLLYALITTWFTPITEAFLQLRFSLFVIALCFAHCSLLLLVKPHNAIILATRAIAIIASALITIIVVFVISTFDASPEVFKVLGVMAIVAVIATIVAPVLAFTAKKIEAH